MDGSGGVTVVAGRRGFFAGLATVFRRDGSPDRARNRYLSRVLARNYGSLARLVDTLVPAPVFNLDVSCGIGPDYNIKPLRRDKQVEQIFDVDIVGREYLHFDTVGLV